MAEKGTEAAKSTKSTKSTKGGGAAKGDEVPQDAASGEEPELSYEQARDELNNVVRQLESGGLSLKDSLALWERGEELARVCEQWLEGARAKLAAAMDEREGEDSGDEAPTPF